MKLPNELRGVLLELFEWAGKDYSEALKTCKEPGSPPCFSIDKPEIARHWSRLKELFLGNGELKKKLHLELFDTASSRTPAFTEEKLFQIAVEGLLEWAGMSLAYSWGSLTPENFMEHFEAALDAPPTEVTLLPIFRLNINTQMVKAEPIRISDKVSFGRFTGNEERLLKFHAQSLASLYKLPGFTTILPGSGLKIERLPSEKREALQSEVTDAMNCFRVFMRAFFRFNVNLQFQFVGRRFSWHPWDYSGGSHPQEFEETKGYLEVRDFEYQLIQKYWPMLYPTVLNRYAITANRLAMVETRDFWQDRVVDLSIAMESLIEGETDLSHRIATIVPNALYENPEERKAAYIQLKEFYDLRSAIVHGESIESRRKLKRKFQDLSKADFEKELQDIEGKVQDFLRLQLLNDHLRTSEGQNDLLLGAGKPIVRNPTI